ncbi:WD40-repeat-containing domain protein [Thamnocephalis sphaerospora]|uniref:Glutamate-rich WD repeat-containing protein 1 n=1 Tax=Thamnocephalis sphaerospora TaxID=78915 RepID=A0A4P9XPB5_9FUNG|nr:WD40-repeat-containing domain protein [Thamnocephalis sphaerospora]|eukprot:RKP07271.1 WD40-repeat-containing domain protein [Thamnocephalis sphaerospora]
MDEDMGEFEDVWEDELESDSGEEIVDGEAQDGDEAADAGKTTRKYQMEVDDEREVKVYLPGQKLEKDEVLEVDNSAYEMLHSMNVKWPCLSFDVLRDDLGEDRSKYPHTAYIVAGTQADKPKNNEVMVMKMAQLHRTSHDDEDNTDEEDEDDLDDDPILEHRSIKHIGGVNRIRTMQHGQTQLAATWADTGKVHIWDISMQIQSLARAGATAPKNNDPLFTMKSHTDEGFAMDWSTLVPGKLLTGDCKNAIYLTSATDAGFQADLVPFKAHQDSVEDLQWSPAEKTVFASCSADRTIRIWDTRAKRNKEALGFEAHQADVNVITWNRKVSYLMASGSDDGIISIWDMRTFVGASGGPTPVATFKWHNAPITSIEWSPQEESVLAVSGADDQLTLWDLSVEPDPEEEAAAATTAVDAQGNPIAVPPQLLFIHQGQNDIKELHWHPQIPGCVVSTAASGFNVFKTISV